MKVVFNIEANGLKATKIWCIVCKDIDTGKIYTFRRVTEDDTEKQRFLDFCRGVTCWIGHNILGYDIHTLRLLGDRGLYEKVSSAIEVGSVIDTLIVSKMADFSRKGHSTSHFAEEFGIDKPSQPSWSDYSEELVQYCTLLVRITERIYLKYLKYLSNKTNIEGITTEHKFQLKVIEEQLHKNGFCFNIEGAKVLLDEVQRDLLEIDDEIRVAFPPREVLIREFTPTLTKFGTISRTSVPKSLAENIHTFEAGKTYRHTKFVEFNPSSHKQLIEVLNEAGWRPTEKTATHIETERELAALKREKLAPSQVDLRAQELHNKLQLLSKTGWKINETNLSTLPPSAPAPARALAKRILLEARRRTLTEWLGLVNPDTSRIHGRFYGIGAWTHRMAHQQPNTANIPNEFDTAGNKKLLGKEMRSLWQAPRNRLLVGVDAEGIQLRVFAHYIDDPEFTKSLVEGRKDDKTDPHSLNQRILGPVCKSRAAAKRFIYALLLGAGLSKLSEILGCKDDATRAALDNLLQRYSGFAELKKSVIPKDARRGWFRGLDGRQVPIPGDDEGYRRHLCMSGYLQNGEVIAMKRATLLWLDQLRTEDIKLVNFVHDEWQTEVPNDMEVALRVAKIQADSLRIVGEELKLKCPLAGSYWNDDLKDYTISTNWAYTH